MNTIVTKFGGSSLADSIHFKKVKNILESNPERKYIIPSAPGKSSFKFKFRFNFLFKYN